MLSVISLSAEAQLDAAECAEVGEHVVRRRDRKRHYAGSCRYDLACCECDPETG